MKKSMIFVGLLAIGYANAQEGKVGINTVSPRATLEIQANATNLADTTNEGIIAPQLSKTRVANIATPVEGTFVYVTDEQNTENTGLITDYTGNDAKVADITEKGYYFYNGTKWVKQIDGNSVGTHLLWEKEANTGNIKLVDAISGNNNIYYNTTNGGHVILPKTIGTYKKIDRNNGAIIDSDLNEQLGNITNIKLAYGHNMKHLNDRQNEWGQLIKTLGAYRIITDQKDDVSLTNGYTALNGLVEITPESTKNYNTITGGTFTSNFNGTGNVTGSLIGTYSLTTAANGNLNNVVGAYNQADLYGKIGNVKNITSTYNYVKLMGNSTSNIGHIIGSHSYLDILSSQNIEEAIGMHNTLYIPSYHKGSINKLYGVAVNYNGVESVNNINENYGLYITGITKGKNYNFGIKIDNVGKGNANNYAIYTGTGKVRFGDNVGIGIEAPNEKLEVAGKIKAANVIFTGIPTYANDTEAGTNGLVAGEMYKTATGELRIKL